MARPIMCDAGNHAPAIMLITNLDEGQVLAWCAEHFVQWVMATAEAFTTEAPPEPEPVTPGQLFEMREGDPAGIGPNGQEPETAATAGPEEGAAPIPPSRKRGPTGRRAAQPAPSEAEAPTQSDSSDDR